MVRSSFQGITTAFSALQASQKRLDITGQNLANMNTTGYTRQQLDTVSLNSLSPVSSYMSQNSASIGFGVGITGVSQIRDPLLDVQYRNQMSKASYTDAIQTSLDGLASILDESTIGGIRQAFADVQSALTTMQNPSYALDESYEIELRNAMEALTNKFNEAARYIEEAEQTEYERLDGSSTSQNGAVDVVNDMLRQIASLNRQIKSNEVVGQNSLELRDARNVLLDELASYLPIEVSYFLDTGHDGVTTDANGNTVPALNELYDYDGSGKIVGKKNWPEDVRVDLVYKDHTGATQRLTLVNGSEGYGDDNYGQLSIEKGTGGDLSGTKITVQGSPISRNGQAQNPPSIEITGQEPATATITGGSIQASLDMLGKNGVPATEGGTGSWRGYGYYMDQLDTLAAAFVNTINTINNQGQNKNSDLLGGDTAATMCIADEWYGGIVHVTPNGENITGNILDMLEAMTKKFDGNTEFPAGNSPDLKGNSFAEFASHISVTLASDSQTNQTRLKSEVSSLNAVQNSRDAISGVSLDEEAANMMVYMSAYNAASRLMTTMDEALDRLINNTGVVGR